MSPCFVMAACVYVVRPATDAVPGARRSQQAFRPEDEASVMRLSCHARLLKERTVCLAPIRDFALVRESQGYSRISAIRAAEISDQGIPKQLRNPVPICTGRETWSRGQKLLKLG